MKLKGFDVRYSSYLYIAGLILMFCHITSSLFAAVITEDLYISRDFTKEGIFTGGCEGPAIDSHGNLYAVNLTKDGTIAIVDTAGNARIYATLPAGSIGNGIRFDRCDNMYIADYARHNIFIIPSGKTLPELYLHQALFNQPNDQSTDFFQFQNDGNQQIDRILVFNLQGRQVIDIPEAQKASGPIGIDFLNPGAYLVKIQTGTTSSVQKLIVR